MILLQKSFDNLNLEIGPSLLSSILKKWVV